MFAPECHIEMSKNKRSRISTPDNGKSPSKSRKYLLPALAGAILIIGVYLFFRHKNETVPGMTGEITEEKILTAEKPLLELLSPDATGIDFENIIVEDEQHNVIRNINFYNGGGVAVADINNDTRVRPCTRGITRILISSTGCQI